MTSRSEFWVKNWRFPSFMIVQWTSNVGGQRVRQLISPKIITPVGEGAGELLNNVLCGKAPPRDLAPYIFIVEGARRVFFRVEASPYKIQCHSVLCRSHLITISLTESRISLSTGVPRTFLFSRSICILASLGLGNSRHCTLFITIVLGWKVCQWWPKLAWGNESEMGWSYIKRNEWNPEELVKAYKTLSTCPWWWRSISEDWRFTILTWEFSQ